MSFSILLRFLDGDVLAFDINVFELAGLKKVVDQGFLVLIVFLRLILVSVGLGAGLRFLGRGPEPEYFLFFLSFLAVVLEFLRPLEFEVAQTIVTKDIPVLHIEVHAVMALPVLLLILCSLLHQCNSQLNDASQVGLVSGSSRLVGEHQSLVFTQVFLDEGLQELELVFVQRFLQEV